MKNLVLKALAMVSFAALPAYSAESTELQRIQALKSQIVAIATSNQTDLSNLAEVRAELDPLVSELASLQSLTAEQSLTQKVGSWRQLWTDDADDVRANNLFVTVDRKQTYQVVLKNGTFYNASVIEVPFGIQFSAFLKGTYEPAGKILNLEFTALKLRLGGLSDVTAMVEKLENNRLIGVIPFPGGGKTPNGPVGVKGEIETVFIDQDLRVDYGQNLDDGIQDLFILVRN